MNKVKIIKLILCLILPLLVGGLSGIATAKGVGSWYLTIEKPTFNPPNYVFAPVWTLLYLLMGIALFMLTEQVASKQRNKAIALWGLQLVLNFVWSFLFFYFENPAIALMEIVMLWGAIAGMIFYMYKVKPLIAYTQLPYIMWVSFATVLNAAIWWLNR